MLGQNWPQNGEIDIIEGVNSATTNQMTLHTAPGCSVSNTRGFSGQLKTENCYVNAPGQGQNVGCGITTQDNTTYGDGFNEVGGGVYAMQWTDQAISVFHFSRAQIPADIVSGSPEPSTWGSPLAQFQGSCNVNQSFRNLSLVINISMCGAWAGAPLVWNSDPVCGAKAPTCEQYVQNNPSAFAESYFEFNSIKVYQASSGSAPPNPSGPAPISYGGSNSTAAAAPSATISSEPSAAATSASTSSAMQAIPTASTLSIAAAGASPSSSPTTAAPYVVQTTMVVSYVTVTITADDADATPLALAGLARRDSAEAAKNMRREQHVRGGLHRRHGWGRH